MMASRFENCDFLQRKFNGHNATETDLVNRRFIGRSTVATGLERAGARA